MQSSNPSRRQYKDIGIGIDRDRLRQTDNDCVSSTYYYWYLYYNAKQQILQEQKKDQKKNKKNQEEPSGFEPLT